MIDIEAVLERLLNEEKIFCSEADFQFAFAWRLKEAYGAQADVRLEFTPWEYSDKIHLDIAVIAEGKLIPIELKYRKAKLDVCLDNGERIRLKAHTAHDTGAYEYLLDIERLEKLILSEKYPVSEAYAIMLTNDSAYWRDTRMKGLAKQPNDMAFRIYSGVELSGIREWSPAAGKGTIKGHERPICIAGKYSMAWRECKPVNWHCARPNANKKAEPNILFKYNVVKCTKEGLARHGNKGGAAT